MAGQRTIRGMLHNFLRTFTSRHSDFNGYWLFGFLTEEIYPINIDLIRPSNKTNRVPLDYATELATRKFAEQALKAEIALTRIHEAWLTISKSTAICRGAVNGRSTPGFNMIFEARVITNSKRTLKSQMHVFVAPHNPTVETRSTRWFEAGSPNSKQA